MSFGNPVSSHMDYPSNEVEDVFGQSLTEFDVWRSMKSPMEKTSRRELSSGVEVDEEEYARTRKPRSERRRTTSRTSSTSSNTSSSSSRKVATAKKSSKDKPHSRRSSKHRNSESSTDTSSEAVDNDDIMSLAPVLSDLEILEISRKQHQELSKKAPAPDYDKYALESDSGYGSDDYDHDEADDKIGILMKQLKKEKETTAKPTSMRGSFLPPSGDGISSEVKARRKRHKLEVPSILKNKGDEELSSPRGTLKATISPEIFDVAEKEIQKSSVSSRKVCFNKPHTTASLKDAVKEKLTVSSIRAGINSSTNGSYIRRSGSGTGGGDRSKQRRDSVRDSLKSFLDATPLPPPHRRSGGSASVEGIRSVRSAPAVSGRKGLAPKIRSSRRLISQRSDKELGGGGGGKKSSGHLDLHFNTQRVHATGQLLDDLEHRSVYSAPAGAYRDNNLTDKFKKLNMNF